MNRLLKYVAYLIIFSVSFVVFLYLVFPYDVLKERLVAGIERQLGGAVEVSAGKLEPYWFTGVEVKKLAFSMRDGSGTVQSALAFDRLTMRVALFSLVVGRPRVSYYIRAGKGEIEGYARQFDEGIEIDASFDDFDLAAVPLLDSVYGLKFSGCIDGSFRFKFDRQQLARSSGEVNLDLRDFKLGESTVRVGPLEMPLPALTLTKSRGSAVRMEVGKGTVQLDKLILEGGDVGLNVLGKVFLSNTVPNSRLNIRGSFIVSEELGKTLPFLFIIEKEKRPDGSYPINVTGRISSPVIKVGNFTLPL